MKDRDLFDNWYKRKVETRDESPPEDSWDNISNKLDVNSVWENVNSQLNHLEDKRRKRRAFAYFIFAGISFLLGYLMFIELNPATSENLHITENKNTPSLLPLNVTKSKNANKIKGQVQNASSSKIFSQNSTESSANHNSFNHSDERIPEKRNNSQLKLFSMYVNTAEDTSSVFQDQSTELPDAIIKESLFPDYLSIKPVQYIETDPKVDIKLTFDSTNSTSHLTSRPNLSGFYIGTLFSGQNSWLWNSQTLSGLSKNSLNQTIPKFGFSYGVSFGYYHTSGWSLQSDLLFDSKYGQSYTSYKEGVYLKENINLHYYQMNLYTVKRINTQLKNKNLMISSGPLVGFNFRYLNNATKQTNMANTIVTAQYSKFDYGILAGYEWDLTIKRKYILFSSLTGDFGFYNIYSGNKSEPKAFDKTFNSSLRLGIGVRYLLK